MIYSFSSTNPLWQNQLPFFSILLYFILILPVQSVLNVFISKDEMNRTLGVNAELWYMENGVINAYASKFPYRLNETVSELRISWNAESENKIHYSMSIESADAQVVAKLLIPHEGYVPRHIDDFMVEYRCAGSRSGHFQVVLNIEFAWPEGNHSLLRLRQEKLCSLKSYRGLFQPPSGSANEESNVQSGIQCALWTGEWLGAAQVFYFIIAAAAFFLALILLFLFFYFRSNKKAPAGGGDSTQSTNAFKMQSSMRTSLHISPRQPFLTSTPTSKPGTSSLIRSIAQSISPLPERSRSNDVRATLCQLYADRNLFQILPYIEMEGTFGEVRWAIWRQNASGLSGDIDEEEDAACSDEAVIVKTLKPTASRQQFEKFLNDALQFHGIPEHPNLAQVVAAASFGRFENPESVTDFPLMCYRHRGFGILKNFLMNCRLEEGSLKRRKSSKMSIPTLRTHELVSIAIQTLRALAHLHRCGIVHTDIATRNCLVSDQPGGTEKVQVQLMDSALAKDLFPADYACLADNDNRPVKWMAPESLTTNTYTTQSDIWSFGVLLWELLSIGSQPYAETDADGVLPSLERGERLGQPLNCPDPLYEEMLSCWHETPGDRPSAPQLLASLQQFQRTLAKYV